MAAANPLELVKLVLNSFGGKATVDQIQQVLVPDVVREDWKKWWEGAKRELKKDGHFQVPLKKTEPIIYPGEGGLAAGPAAGGIPRRQGAQGAHCCRRRSCSGTRMILTDKQAAATEVIARPECRDRQLPAHAAGRGPRGDLRPRRHAGDGGAAAQPGGELQAQAIWTAGREARGRCWSSCRRPSTGARWSPSKPPIPSIGTKPLRLALNSVSGQALPRAGRPAHPGRQD